MRKLLNLTTLFILIICVFSGCSSRDANTGSSFSILPQNEPNRQISATTYNQRQSQAGYTYYDYSFTNGDEYVNQIYILKTDPGAFPDDSFVESCEQSYVRKYMYSYEDGDPASTIQIKNYTREEMGSEPEYQDRFIYVRDINFKDKVGVYKSFWIGTDGTEHNDLYYSYQYDDAGRLSVMGDEREDLVRCYYDDEGLLVNRYFDYETSSYSYEKDNDSRITSIRKWRDNEILVQYDYEYDTDNRITQETCYDFDDNVQTQVEERTSYSYDENGNILNIVTETYDSDTESYQITNQTFYYNDNNNLTEIITDDGEDFTYTIFIYSNEPESYSVALG